MYVNNHDEPPASILLKLILRVDFVLDINTSVTFIDSNLVNFCVSSEHESTSTVLSQLHCITRHLPQQTDLDTDFHQHFAMRDPVVTLFRRVHFKFKVVVLYIQTTKYT